MSKISQLHAELSEQASGLGFENISEAEQAGLIFSETERPFKRLLKTT